MSDKIDKDKIECVYLDSSTCPNSADIIKISSLNQWALFTNKTINIFVSHLH